MCSELFADVVGVGDSGSIDVTVPQILPTPAHCEGHENVVVAEVMT